MICTTCGEPATHSRHYEDFCQFHWDCLKHELQIRLDCIRDFGPYGKDNGPTYGATFYGWTHGNPERGMKPKFSTIGMGLYISRTPQEAMVEALRMAKRNNHRLLRLDTQNTVPEWPGKWRARSSCVDLFRDRLYGTFMGYKHLDKDGPVSFDEKTFGPIPAELLKFNEEAYA